MDIRSLLAWNISAANPLVLIMLLAGTAVLAFVFTARPRLYIPLVLLTVPLPKLFTIGYRSATQLQGYSLQSDPGFSVVDLVVAAGLFAVVFRGWRRIGQKEAQGVSRALMLWFASVALSVVVGLVMWTDKYRPVDGLYALRYGLTLLSFGIATQYAPRDHSERTVRSLLRGLAVVGNVTIALGLLYYFLIGSSGGGSHVEALTLQSGSLVFRSPLWFFDYSIDIGYYTVTVAILNLILLGSRQTGVGPRWLYGLGLSFCTAATLVIGERVNLLVFAVSLVYFLWETSKSKQRKLTGSQGLKIVAILVIVASIEFTLNIIAPQAILTKVQGSVGRDYALTTDGILYDAGVPSLVAGFVSALPIGDLSVRMAFSVGSLWSFFHHPEGVGFWGELDVVGRYAHHEVIKIAVEQGVVGLVAFVYLITCLRRCLWSRSNLQGASAQLGILMRTISIGLFTALILANTVLLDMKFALVYWTLLGVWTTVPRYRGVLLSAGSTSRVPSKRARLPMLEAAGFEESHHTESLRSC